mmetsp:Transcript_29161/g.66090  ORF Transcript_29161/g.66090 Transcript_29161/m.66090 type:complete len:91 (-) Transcript_29161:131-403(-)
MPHACQQCGVPVICGSPQANECSGDYPWWSCCVCAARMGWRGWQERACQRCRSKTDTPAVEETTTMTTTTRSQAKKEAHGSVDSSKPCNV